MFNLAEYRKKPDRLADLLPWVALIAPGIVLNKDGSLQRSMYFRGPDLESATDAQLVAITARLNNVLQRFGSGWSLYFEAQRKPSLPYTDEIYFPDPISLLIDTERRERFVTRENFESKYYLTLQFLPPSEALTRLERWFFVSTSIPEADYQKNLQLFVAATERCRDLCQDIMLEAEFLNDAETLTYLHSTISPKQHNIAVPEIPMYLDAFLADTPLLTGLLPQLGSYYLRTISVLSLPFFTLPAILDQLNRLPFNYRWVTRYIALDKTKAETEIRSCKKRWFAKRKDMAQILQEVFSKSESRLLDTAAVVLAQDADDALQELANECIAYGYCTITITLLDNSLERVIALEREVERVINGLGFTTVVETFNAVEAWLSSLPGHAYANVRMPLLHSLNLAHLIPFSHTWSGPERDEHLKAAPLMYTHTHGHTPFRLVNHIGDVGHQMVIGPTGSGKSVLLTLMSLQFRRYKDAQVFIFDKGESFLAATSGVGGGFYELGNNTQAQVFQPLARIDNEPEKIWASEWIYGLLINEEVHITPHIKQKIWEALNSLSEMPIAHRTLTGLCALLQDNSLRQALANYTLCGPFGQLLDADCEMPANETWQCYEMEELMNTPCIVAPLLSYIFHRLESRFTGTPTLLIIDEAWIFLDHPMFARKIREWLKSLRKQNVSVVFATQSIEDAFATSIAATLLESCPTRILLPNDRILEPKIRSSYEKLGLNERQLQILSTGIPKCQYYYQSRLGNRLFNLELDPIAYAYCAAGNKENRSAIKQIIGKYGRDQFNQHYLASKNLHWVLPHLEAKNAL